MDDVRDVLSSVDRRRQCHARPRDLVRIPRDADDAQIRPWGEILDYSIIVSNVLRAGSPR